MKKNLLFAALTLLSACNLVNASENGNLLDKTIERTHTQGGPSTSDLTNADPTQDVTPPINNSTNTGSNYFIDEKNEKRSNAPTTKKIFSNNQNYYLKYALAGGASLSALGAAVNVYNHNWLAAGIMGCTYLGSSALNAYLAGNFNLNNKNLLSVTSLNSLLFTPLHHPSIFFSVMTLGSLLKVAKCYDYVKTSLISHKYF